MKSKRFISLSLMFGLTAGLFASVFSINNQVEAVNASSWTAYTHYDGATYYNDISDTLTGSSLTSALRTLNNSKKKRNGGYTALLKNDFWAKYTDFDSNSSYSQDTTHNLPYSNKIVSFYSGNVATNASGMNREHVWPDSKGGNLVQEDSHMARPTLTSENSSRGNSFYVEGMKSTSQGWDPAMESWGDKTYRGDAARIIFYCAMANGSLSLVDKSSDNNNNKTMGKLSDILRWNLTYGVKQREMNRNEAVEAIQGNRNPFIDHPEYACKIWGNTNAQTKAVCGLEYISISKSAVKLTEGQTTTIYATSKDSSEITWTSDSTNVLTISSSTSASGSEVTLTAVKSGSCTLTAKATIDGTTYSASCYVTVNAPQTDSLSSITLDTTNVKKDFEIGEQFTSNGLVVTANYTMSGSKTVTDYSISTPDLSTVGTKTVTVSYTDNNVTKTASYNINVDEEHISSITLNATQLTLKPGETFQLVATISPESAPNKDVIWAPLSHNVAKVSTLGKVTAKAPGTVTVTATTVDGGKVASCVVTVIESGGGGGSSSSGCGGNIATTSIVLSTLSVLGIGLLLIKRKFSK